MREAITSEDGELSYSLFRLPDDCTSPELMAKHEKTRTAMLKNVAKRDKGTPKWKPFGKGQITLKPRTAPKQTKTPADILKAWAGDVIHEYACDYCGEFECTCVRDTVSAVLADNGGPIVDAESVERGRKGLAEKVVRHECADQISLGEDVPEPVIATEQPEPVMPTEDAITEARELADRIGFPVTGWATADGGWVWLGKPKQGERLERGTGEPLLTVLPTGYFAVPVFPVALEPGESVESFEGEHHRPEDDSHDWAFVTAGGHEYRLCAASYERDRYRVARAPFTTVGSSSGGWFWWAEHEEDNSLSGAVAWCRKDSASQAWARDVWDRHEHMNDQRVPWSAELVEIELEPRVVRFERYGRVGIAAHYPWGWERSASGHLVEAGSGSGAVDGAFKRRAAYYLTVDGLHEIPTERWVIVGTDKPHGKDALECAPGGWMHSGCRARKSDGRFLVDILGGDGTVVGRIGACAEHLTPRLVEAHGHEGDPWDVAYERAGKVGGELGSWVAWQDRLYAITAELVTAALEAGEVSPRPDVAGVLFAEADALRAKREGKEAARAAKTSSKGGETMGRRGMAPKPRAAEPKVGDILFSGDRGNERAELLGQVYAVTMLAGTYTVTHSSGETVCEYEPKRPGMKRAILADATARGEGQPEPEECDECEDECECWGPETDETSPVLGAAESEAVQRFPELAQFLEPRGDDAPMLVLNLFSGPGGMVVGLRDVLRQQLGRDVEIINVDSDADCVKTLKAAGFLAIQADVTSLDPADPVFREVRGLIVTPPCTDYTDSGKRAGLLPENVAILEEGFDLARRVAGFMPFGDMGDHPEFGKEISHKAPNGESWAAVRAEMDEYSGATGHLMLEVAVWSLGLQAAWAPLEWVAVEQSSKLPKELRGEIAADFQLSGWGMAEWAVADAAEFGSPTQRVRALLVARRDGHSGVSLEAPGLRTGAATATGLPEGTPVYTRGVGKRSGGGNVVTISDAKPYTAFTSRIRSVDVGEKGGRFTLAQIMRLITIPDTYPVQGSRTSICQQIGDVVAPVVAAALLGAALGIEWMPHLVAYLAEQYPQVHGADAAETSADVPAGEPQRGEPGFMAALLEQHVGPDWKPLEATPDPEFEDVEEEQPEPAQGLAQVSQQQRCAAWRIAAGEPAPVVEKREQPDHGRRYWESGERVTLNQRAGRTTASRDGKVRVVWDGESDVTGTWESVESLWVEGTEPAPFVKPAHRADDDYLIAPPEPKPYIKPAHYADDDYVLAAPDPIVALRVEIARERADFEQWSAELDAVLGDAGALVVAEAVRVVADAERELEEMEAAELSVTLRRMARESMGVPYVAPVPPAQLDDVEWEDVPAGPTRAAAWAVAASWGAFWISAWGASIDAIRPVR
ncbi:hypothetical protein [Streptomyces purpureus]|uniref:hypothetical protein n=1 Tax=Streptomyces purpureus TaxID=1951 RepID=UPI00131A0976|nr:hypothetical protein [Streptomyces purpureus]